MIINGIWYSHQQILRLFRQRNTAVVTPDLSGGGTASPATPTPSSAAPTPVTPTTPTPTTPATGSTPALPADEIADGNWKQLRDRYEAVRTRAQVLDSLGIPETELPGVVSSFTALRTEASTLATELGYTADDLAEAFKSDPVKTLHLLREEKAAAATQSTVPRQQGESQPDYEARIREEVAKQTKPYTEHINKQISDAVTAKIGTEFTSAFNAVLPDAPPEIRSIIDDYVTESIVKDNSALVAMKARGDYSRVKEITEMVAGRMKSAFAAWVKAEGKRTGQPGTPAGVAGSTTTSRPTLDDMINDPGLINPKYRD